VRPRRPLAPEAWFFVAVLALILLGLAAGWWLRS